MKNSKNLIILLIIISLMGISVAYGLGFEDKLNNLEEIELNGKIVDYVSNQIKESYSVYYTIPKINGEIDNLVIEDNMIKADVSVSFTKKLLAKSASELPYIQGLELETEKIKDKDKKAHINKIIKSRKRDLDENYIGVEQLENADFIIEIPILNGSIDIFNAKLFFKSQFETLSILEFKPPSKDQLFNAGKNKATKLILKADKNEKDTTITTFSNPSSADDYNRIDARKYAQQYASDYNSDYSSYSNDCANFVSQCIFAGGISEETGADPDSLEDWYIDSYVWIRTGYYQSTGVTDYMVDEGFFFEDTDQYSAFAGSIIFWTDQSHVGLVDQNDTVVMTYCAHTDDCLSQSFKDKTNVKFFIPEWDSYAGEWTR